MPPPRGAREVRTPVGRTSFRRAERGWSHTITQSVMSSSDRALRAFVASFLVLFLEVALIRWMPAYIRLLAYFSNFILLASFLGIGVGCLLAPARARLFGWFPLIQVAVILAVYYFRLEISVPTA